MRKYRVTAINQNKLTFQFFIYQENWYKIEKRAKERLEKIVYSDLLHIMHGPWTVRDIDVSA